MLEFFRIRCPLMVYLMLPNEVFMLLVGRMIFILMVLRMLHLYQVQ